MEMYLSDLSTKPPVPDPSRADSRLGLSESQALWPLAATISTENWTKERRVQWRLEERSLLLDQHMHYGITEGWV